MNHAERSRPGSLRERIPGELWMVGVIIGYVSSHLFDKVAVVAIDPLLATLLRRSPSLLLGVILISVQGTYAEFLPSSEKYIGTRTILLLVAAGLLSTLGMFTYFYAMRLGGVVITVPFTQSLVIWGALVGWYVLDERLKIQGSFGLSMVVAGLALLSHGQSSGTPVSPGWLYAIPLALFTAVSWGVAGAFWRLGQLWGADQSTSIFIQFGTSLGFTSIVLTGMGKFSLLPTYSMGDVAIILTSGVLSGVVAIYCVFAALRVMSIVRVYALNSLTPLLAAVLAAALLGEYMNAEMFAGLVVASVGIALIQAFKPRQERRV